jgi:hypothetical protein
MPDFLTRIFTPTANPNSNETVPVHQLEGFQANGAVVLRDRRGALKAEIPDVSEKGMHGMGDDSMAIYRPSVPRVSTPQKHATMKS